MFKKFVDENKINIINSISDLIGFKSVSVETDNINMPFGEECKKVLDYILSLGEKMGFRTKNVDGYCGYIEFGKGAEIVGIIGHLDVVPALEEDGWITTPFEANIRNNKIYGRGAIDDKGPVVASLYAMKAVAENCKINKRVRLILGLNEERNWKCIKRYKQTEEIPTIGFSPDANFPAIYAEKGIISVSITNNFSLNNYEILYIDCNGNALNVVPKYVAIKLRYTGTSNKIKFENEKNISVEELECNVVKITSTGIASHAAHPELGKNAITILINYLSKYFENDYLKTLLNLGIFDIENPKFLNENLVIQDESGILTSNVAVLEYIDGKLIIKINLRVPVKTNLDEIMLEYKNLANIFESIEIKELGRQNPLLVDKNSFLVQTLVNIYNKVTNSNEEAIAIGGGTYARAFANCISYGATMPSDLDMCHQVDEFIDIDKLMLTAEIYAEAIYELAK